MKQLFFRGGQPIVSEVPPPGAERGRILVEVTASALSPGTELSNLDASGRSFVSLALEKRKRIDRLVTALKRRDLSDVRERLRRLASRREAWLPVGYSAAGIVAEVGSGLDRFAPGERVAVAGAGHASHAERITVPSLLAVSIPAGVEDAAASTVALGAIALQAVRRAECSLGDRVLVLGLGVLGQLALRLLLAAGARVLAWDPDPNRRTLAEASGAILLDARDSDDVPRTAAAMTDGWGADRVILAASAGAGAVATAAGATRRAGRLVLLGNTPVEVPRDLAYVRELTIAMSTSYGPGRYDSRYEDDGVDYPLPHARWTENRNMAAYLELLSMKRVSLEGLFRIVPSLDDAPQTYADLRRGDGPPGAVFLYAKAARADAASAKVSAPLASSTVRMTPSKPVRVAVIGSGNYAGAVLLPALAREAGQGRARIDLLVGSNPARREPLARAHSVARTSEQAEEALGADVDLVVIATRHDRHAEWVERALRAGKAVFCEKPLALRAEEIDRTEAALRASPNGFLCLGLNRRFSPAVLRWQERLATRRGPLHLAYRIQAGALSAGHWLHGPEGGGRLIGEGVHMVDLCRALAGRPLARAGAMSGGGETARDNFSIVLGYDDGSTATVAYTARGSEAHPKERIEGHWDGSSVELDDFRELREAGRSAPLWQAPQVDKGQAELIARTIGALLDGRPAPIPADELFESSRAVVALDGEAAR